MGVTRRARCEAALRRLRGRWSPLASGSLLPPRQAGPASPPHRHAESAVGGGSVCHGARGVALAYIVLASAPAFSHSIRVARALFPRSLRHVPRGFIVAAVTADVYRDNARRVSWSALPLPRRGRLHYSPAQKLGRPTSATRRPAHACRHAVTFARAGVSALALHAPEVLRDKEDARDEDAEQTPGASRSCPQATAALSTAGHTTTASATPATCTLPSRKERVVVFSPRGKGDRLPPFSPQPPPAPSASCERRNNKIE